MCADAVPAAAQQLEASLRPTAVLAIESPAPAAAWAEPAFAGKLAFVKCTLDKALPVSVQDMFMERSGVRWVVRQVEASHSAFLSRPAEVAAILQELVGEFVKRG